MKYAIVLSALSALLFTSCAKRMFLNDEALYDQYLTKSYEHSPDECYEATRAALAENKIPVKSENPEKRTLVTEKYEGLRFAVHNYSHTSYTSTGASVVHQQYQKYHFAVKGVKGNKQQCVIKVTKFRAWTDQSEAEWVNPDWCAQNLWGPLFGAIQEELEGDDEDEADEADESEGADDEE